MVYTEIMTGPRDRAEAWAEVTARALMTTTIQYPEPATFNARLRAMQLGAAQVSAMSYRSLACRRTHTHIRRSDPEQYVIALVRSGCQTIEQARTQSRIETGQMILYDSSYPYDANVGVDRADATLLHLQFPKKLLPLREDKVARLLAVPLPVTSGIGRVFAQFLTTVTDEHAATTPRDTARLNTIALDLTAAVLAHHLDDTPALPSSASPQVLFLHLTSFINQHLRHPDLGPAMIAAAHHISPRHLHRIFQRHNATVSAYIKQRRLNRCQRDLADPALRHVAIHTIAGRWGFTSPADFSRAFRAATGMPPSRYRATVDRGVAAD
ncbi:helix-turn-helix domain-containing protein [Amycolatopsis keratiniphila]|uniref:helix-turn-helix domain-containing protein n=1 Tax=Amycolatopsis keratiniphila TaxID=129921 RepID=UPI000879A32E|nr:helix-turn-helix domain-containing protein [Amycolatopsis keratiniphila]SDU10208.1 AraC-type DNA-binding protein [Amycolatopsis keratiniphila]